MPSLAHARPAKPCPCPPGHTLKKQKRDMIFPMELIRGVFQTLNNRTVNIQSIEERTIDAPGGAKKTIVLWKGTLDRNQGVEYWTPAELDADNRVVKSTGQRYNSMGTNGPLDLLYLIERAA